MRSFRVAAAGPLGPVAATSSIQYADLRLAMPTVRFEHEQQVAGVQGLTELEFLQLIGDI